MIALSRNELLREDVPAQRALLYAGGKWVALNGADLAEVVSQARTHGIRALHVAGKDLSLLAELPDDETDAEEWRDLLIAMEAALRVEAQVHASAARRSATDEPSGRSLISESRTPAAPIRGGKTRLRNH